MRVLLGLLLVLTACAPAYVQPRPIVYQTDYNSLFRAVVEIVVTTPVQRGGLFSSQVVFEVEKAEERAGLITASLVEQPSVRVSASYGNAPRFFILDTPSDIRRYVVQFVIKREGRNASIVYSTSSTVGDPRLPNRLVELVLLRLGDRFKRVESL